MQKNKIAREKMLAIWQVEAMAERLKANQTPASQSREFSHWKAENQALFRNPKSELSCSKNFCEIRLMWGRGQHVELRV
jgi:hypothetical protein